MRFVLFILIFVSNCLFPKDVVFVKLNSGIGNQMFQFAAAYSLAQTIGADLKIVASNDSDADLKDVNDRKYTLNNKDFCFDGIDFVSEEEMNKEPFVYVWEGSDYQSLKGKGRIVIGSFFESEIFFKAHAKNIKKIFSQRKTKTPFIKKHLREIKKCNSVAVHIRRGDFKNFPDRIMPLTYYMQAMQKFSSLENVKFFVFSDDPEYVKSCFFNADNIVIVSDVTATKLEEFYLMTQCKHFIIANSTFSWWAAYLCENPAAIVVAPSPKYKDDYFLTYPEGDQRNTMKWIHTEKAYPDNWRTINPFALFQVLSHS